MLPIESPFPLYVDLDGDPLDAGFIYFGQLNLNPVTNPVTVYWDSAGTQPVLQPLRTENGLIVRNGSPAHVFCNVSYSMLVQDKKSRQIYYEPNSDDYSVASYINSQIASFNAFITNLASSAGSTLVGFIQSGTGAVKRTVQDALRESNHSVYNFFLASESTAEGMINRCIAAHNRVHIPAGVYNIDVGTGKGIIVKTGTVITGDGKNKTILNAVLGTGSTLAGLAGYNVGSVIRRDFNPLGPNSYVNDVYMADFAVVLNHPAAAITANSIQIGFDMRNITGSTIERCHAGNYYPVGGPVAQKTAAKQFIVQGYPVVFGNVSGSDPAYAGGEKNRLLNSSVYGGYKCVIQDETTLSPNSASYATVVRDCDIQTGHWLIGQMGQYGAGNRHIHNILQDIQKKSGDASNSYIMYYDGYNNRIEPAYIEGGSGVDYQVYLDSDANNNVIDLLMAGVTGGSGLITDASAANSFNRITYMGNNGIGPLLELYNKSLRKQWVKFHWTGAAIVIDATSPTPTGTAHVVTRTGTGDYTITWAVALPAASWNPGMNMHSDASAHSPSIDIVSQTATNIRISTSINNAGVTTILDPLFVWVSAEQ